MTDKLIDNEIVKEFQLRTLKAEHPGFVLCGQIVDLINRLQAENERLRYNLEAVLDERADHSEAYKEFAEWIIREYPETEYFVSNLLKELAGDNQ